MSDETDLRVTVPASAASIRPVGPVRLGTSSVVDASFRYRDADVLGVGGMGQVMLARDARIGRAVALKELRAEHASAPDARARFLREAQVQGQLEHPSIVPVYDIDTTPDGELFFTMRRVLGKTLATIIDELREGTAHHTQRELLQAFATVCLTIDYAHSRGVVHRDLKPANIMLGDFGEVYVLDWGLARILDDGTVTPMPASRLSSPGETFGTPLYMAPEQMDDSDVGPSADIYALGAILFEILTLEQLRNPRAIAEPVDARASVRAPEREVAPELETICVNATALDAEERYPSARAVQEAVARYLEGDRELAQRRQLAAEHAARAREALERADSAGADADLERGTAMRELQRALLLEPDREHVAMLAEMMSTPPREPPKEVAASIELSRQAVARSGAKYSAMATLSWFAYLPAIALLGIRRYDYMMWVAVPSLITIALGFVASRQERIGRPIQMVMAVAWFVAAMGLSRMFGPLILMPTIIASFAIVSQAHPDRVIRAFCLVGAASSIILPTLLELAGLLPRSVTFSTDGLRVLPQMTELPETATLLFVIVANACVAVVPALFIGRLRGDLTRSQERQILHTWHFRRLGEDLVT
ncbi:MAG: protein kinase [Kofleriaceae bacterium]|nr:protein kinase [Kofleriaceae bacterium]